VIEQIDQLWWLFSPFESDDYMSVVVWYLVGVLLITALTYVADLLGMVDTEQDNPLGNDMSLKEKFWSVSIVAPVLEEIAFRIAPFIFFSSPIAVIATSIAWALAHGKKGIVILAIVPLFVKLTLAGMFIELIVVHAFHNTAMLAITEYTDSD